MLYKKLLWHFCDGLLLSEADNSVWKVYPEWNNKSHFTKALNFGCLKLWWITSTSTQIFIIYTFSCSLPQVVLYKTDMNCRLSVLYCCSLQWLGELLGATYISRQLIKFFLDLQTPGFQGYLQTSLVLHVIHIKLRCIKVLTHFNQILYFSTSVH